MLRVEGVTGPYIQYTHARASSILRKAQHAINLEVTPKS
jgi:arginyl-tRNA synthetase